MVALTLHLQKNLPGRLAHQRASEPQPSLERVCHERDSARRAVWPCGELNVMVSISDPMIGLRCRCNEGRQRAPGRCHGQLAQDDIVVADLAVQVPGVELSSDPLTLRR